VGLYQHAPDERRRRLLAKWHTPRVPYVHSFGLTPEHAVLIAHPFDVAPARLLFTNAAFIDRFRWRPEQGTRLIVIDRATGERRTHHCDPMFVFHTAHAFDDGDAVVLDVVAHADAGVISSLTTAGLANPPASLGGRLLRLTLRRGVERATVEPISDVRLEFPVSGGSRAWGRPSRWLWATSFDARDWSTAIVKVDLETGTTRRFVERGVTYGEPIRVARPGASAEDDGLLLAVGSSLERDATTLAVLDAASLEVVAHGEIDVAVPLGLHGGFFPA
jgi:carotenoid cleavage dioxygenase-like enzyme